MPTLRNITDPRVIRAKGNLEALMAGYDEAAAQERKDELELMGSRRVMRRAVILVSLVSLATIAAGVIAFLFS